jgi:hypothetical protein
MIPANRIPQLRVMLSETAEKKAGGATDIYTDTIIDILQQLQDIEIELVESITSLGSIGVFSNDSFEEEMDFDEQRYQLTGDRNIDNLVQLLQCVRLAKEKIEKVNDIFI